ncbi:MAG: tRNA threonylcarbamoyladenosine dehydratase [Chromatiaceae bacterium]|nr:tRNA threonylcarbamoyladenosine dehydratase [Chromatiaceae bacterium]
MSGGLADRTAILIGPEGVARLGAAHVLVAGLGGVGGHAAEALARAGVGALSLVDHDRVDPTNLNRQILALHSTLGRPKVEVMAERIADINPNCRLRPRQSFLDETNIEPLLGEGVDLVIDAIDSLASKVALLEHCVRRDIPVFSSMGAGGRLDPGRVRLGDLMDTQVCGLARAVRTQLRKRGIGRGIRVVWSDEAPRPPLPPSEPGARAINGTLSYLPALFGLMLAGEAVRQLLGEAQ